MQRHLQGRTDQFGIEVAAQAPTHDSPREAVQDHRQVQPALDQTEVRDVRQPLLIRTCSSEVPPQPVGGDRPS